MLQISGEYFAPRPIGDGGALICRHSLILPAASFALLVQVQADAAGVEQPFDITVTIEDHVDGRQYARHQRRITGQDAVELDSLIFRFDMPAMAPATLSVYVSDATTPIRLRHLKLVRSDAIDPRLADFSDTSARFSATSVKAIFVGTTNICNANCAHCPTNKSMTAHLERGIMSMDLFDKLLDGLEDVNVQDSMLFGVFGEPFADPHLELRIAKLRQRFPEMAVDIATNGALADEDRVARIVDKVRRISIHVEGATAAVYDKLMAPLKAGEVFPRVDRLIERFGAKITVTTPLHRANAHEVPWLKQRWGDHGADVAFLPLHTRASERTLAKRIGLAPTAGFWREDLVDIVVIDWDGTVLATCDDFLRRQPLGSLATASLPEILDGAPRRALFDNIMSYRWSELPSINDAVVDDHAIVRAYSALALDSRERRFHAHRLSCGPNARRVQAGIVVTPSPSAAALVYGPYVSLPPGRFLVRVHCHVDGVPQDANFTFEISRSHGRHRYAAVRRSTDEMTSTPIGIEFLHDAPGDMIELRIFAERFMSGTFYISRFDFTQI
jgi:hypothetical protein